MALELLSPGYASMVCWVSLPLGLLVNALIALQSLGFGVQAGIAGTATP